MRVQPSSGGGRPVWVMARLLPLCLLMVACGGEFHTPAQSATVGVVAKTEPLTSNGHLLSVTRTRLILGSVELINAEGGSEVVEGPFLVDAALDGRWVKLAETALPRGSYSALKLNFRPLASSSAGDVEAAKAANFTDLLDTQASVSIDGNWDGSTFSQRPKGPSTRVVTFAKPWQVRLGPSSNLSLATNSETWFPRDSNGELNDPRGDDADDVLDTFASGLQGVEDDDRNGEPDP